MLLTRSIRRKLVTLAVLVALMLCALMAAALWGVFQFRRFVNDPDFNVLRGPRRAEVVEALAGLVEPEWLDVAAPVPGGMADWQERIAAAQRRVREYREARQSGPVGTSQWVGNALLSEIEAELQGLRRDAAAFPGGQVPADQIPRWSLRLQRLITLAAQIPETRTELREKAAAAREAYHTAFWALVVSGAFVVVLFLVSSGFVYRSLFRPIRELHEVASRMAQGHFEYRARLRSGDEMAELAETLNRIAERFCQKQEQWDREVRERSRQLIRTQALVGTGFLAAGVAHEINNPLAAIRWSADAVASRLRRCESTLSDEDRRAIERSLSTIRKESERCRVITARLSEFSRGVDQPREPVDAAALTREVIEMVRALGRFRDRQLQLHCPDRLVIEAKRVEFKQVVLNLVANALESTGPGGRVDVSLDERADAAILTVRDDGCGIAAEHLEHLFEPFFTHGKEGQGTGLGLAICHRIVTEHGGHIAADSDGPGRGATFTVCWPKHLPQRQQPNAERMRPAGDLERPLQRATA